MRKIIALGIMLLFLGMTISSSTGISLEKQSIKPLSFGNILYVGGNGTGNYTKIQDAIDDASDGDTVFVYSGVYKEWNIKVDKSINLVGEDKNTTIIDGDEKGDNVVKVSADRVNISGFIIKNSYISSSGVGISGNFVSVAGNKILDNYFGIVIDGSDDNIIEDNNISDNYWVGINLRKANDNTIRNNDISDNDVGVRLDYSENNTITNNSFNDGLYVEYSYKNTVTDNTVNGRPLVYLEDKSDLVFDEPDAGQVILVNCTNITVKNQELSNAIVGVELLSSSYCVVSDNNINNMDKAGISLYNSYQNSITGNHITSSGYGIYLEDCKIVNISMNHILDNYYSLKLFSCKNVIVTNNNIEKNGRGIGLHYVKDSRISKNTILSNTRGEDGDPYRVPGIFLDYSSGNTIKYNTISHIPDSGLRMGNSNENLIFANKLSYCRMGIDLYDSNDNIINKNHVLANPLGIQLGGANDNTVICNNFIFNIRNARFIQCKNSWDKNYWNRMHVPPKLIFGWKIIFVFQNPPLPGLPFPLPETEFDWRPALLPYDIPEV